MRYTLTIIIAIFVILAKHSIGQNKTSDRANNYVLKIEINNTDNDFELQSYQSSFNDSLSLIKEFNRVITEIQSIGYAESSVDSIGIEANQYTYYLSIGQKYHWRKLEFNSSEWKMLQNLKQQSLDFDNKDFDYNELLALQKDIITRFENSGYPFASTRLSNIEIIDNMISAKLIINKGSLIIIDTLQLTDFDKISSGFIQQYLGIKIGSEYNESQISKSEKILKRLDFLQLKAPLRVDFTKGKADILLSLKEKKINQFNGIIGMAPDNKTKKIQFTGNLNLKLINSFGRGERLAILWESSGNNSQLLELNIQYPYLFNSPFGVALDFEIDKKDSTFVNIEYKPALQFAMSGQDYISAYAHIFQSNYLLNNNKASNNPNLNDVNSQTAGLGLNINRLDNIFNPRRGFSIKINADGGYKQIIKYNNEIEEKTEGLLFRGNSELQYFIPLFTRQTIRLANSMALIEGEDIMINELYRIGGFKTLRGFDEQSIYAKFYNIYSMEYRLLLDEYSYLGAFYNIGQIVNPYADIRANAHQSLGLSFNFATKAGVFSLAYALGKSEVSNFEFGQAKIHFGYFAVF